MDSIHFPVNNFFATVLHLISPEKLCKAARGEFATKKEEISLCLDVLNAIYMSIITYRRKLLMLSRAFNAANNGELHYVTVHVSCRDLCEWFEELSNGAPMDVTSITMSFARELPRHTQLRKKKQVTKDALFMRFHYCGHKYCAMIEPAFPPTLVCTIPTCEKDSKCMCMCGGCGRWYCSSEHKKLDWKENGHKQVCNAVRKLIVVEKKKC